MEKPPNGNTGGDKGPDLNGNSAKFYQPKNETNEPQNGFNDHIITKEGRIIYPCQYCNKVFPIRKTRAVHIKTCPAKEYILSVDDTPEIKVKQKAPTKIDIHQNIILNQQMDLEQLLSETKSPPIKLTIRRIPNNGNGASNHFTISNSLILKEKNETRLEDTKVTIKQPQKIDTERPSSSQSDEGSETSCIKCRKEFGSPLELLRHTRKIHSYPKVQMALSEVKKFYKVKDRSECPICCKPLKAKFRSAFVKHLHTHTKEMKYSCEVCKKKFRRSDHMNAHQKRHVVNVK